MKFVRRGIVAAGLAGLVALWTGVADARPSNFEYFFIAHFQANSDDFKAYLDLNNETRDSHGLMHVIVKTAAYSSAYRDRIKNGAPGAETAAYGIETFTLNCRTGKSKENPITFYADNGVALRTFDFHGKMKTPTPGTMSAILLKRVCGG